LGGQKVNRKEKEYFIKNEIPPGREKKQGRKEARNGNGKKTSYRGPRRRKKIMTSRLKINV